MMRSLIDALEASLLKGDDERLRGVADRLIRAAWLGEVQKLEAERAMKGLQESAQFDLMVRLGDALLANGASGHVRRQYCQALIELGALAAAEHELGEILENTPTPEERSEALGLLGRISKQRFVARRRRSDLDQAIDYYRAGWETNFDPGWHGINLVSLEGLGRQLDPPPGEGLGDDMSTLVLESLVDSDTEWVVAIEAELSLALGNLEGASNAIARLVASDVPVFRVQSLRRQLSEIWDLDEADPLLLELDNRLAGPGDLVLPSGDDLGRSPDDALERFEKIFGTAQALSFWNLVDGLVAAQSVGKVTDRSGRGIGTAFLVAGDVISDSLGSGPILVTNAHVISAEHNGAIRAVDAQVRFQVTRDENGEPLVCDGLTEIWSSPLNECDITLLRFDDGRPSLQSMLEPADGLPAVIAGAYVTVVGHPAGGELSLSLRGNDLIESDGQRLHYVAPTKPGSSGSPVFDQNWKLIGVHHAGHQRMPRLAGDGYHKANEATTLDYIRAQFSSTEGVASPGFAEAAESGSIG